MTIDFQKLATPTAEVMGDPRSCANCLHRRGFTTEFARCVRTGTYAEIAVRYEHLCGLPLRYWTVKPPSIWRRLWERLQQRHRAEGGQP